MPLYISSLFLIYFRKIGLKKGILCAILFSIIALPVVFDSFLQGSHSTKFEGTTFINNQPLIYEHIIEPRLKNQDKWWVNLRYNRPVYYSSTLIKNFVSAFGPGFLLLDGESTLAVFKGPFMGKLNPVLYLFFIVGLVIILFKQFKYKKLLLAWLIVSIIPSIITKRALVSTRMLAMLPAIILIAVFGIGKLLEIINQRRRKVFISIALLVYFVFFIYFAHGYLKTFPYQMCWQWNCDFKPLNNVLNSADYNNKTVYFDHPEYLSYILLFFYNKEDPVSVQQQTVRYEPDQYGFYQVKKYQRYNFYEGCPEEFLKDTIYVYHHNSKICPGEESSQIIYFGKNYKALYIPKW
jgi:hypothetical protein